jgi:hypothetical protein
MIIIHNIDRLFLCPHMSCVAAGCWVKNKDFNLNSGLMVVIPNKGDYDALIKISIEQCQQCQSDQNIIQKHFLNWSSRTDLHLGMEFNVFAAQIRNIKDKFYIEKSDMDKNLKPLCVIHYITPKPWVKKDIHLISSESQFLYDRWHTCYDKILKSLRK